MRRLFLCFMAAVMAMVLAACGGGSSKNVFTDPDVMGQIMGALQNRDELKGQELMVFQDVTVVNSKDHGGNFIVIHLLKPGTKEDVDQYEYRGGSWSSPSPVTITGDGDMADNLTPWNEFQFEKLPVMYKAMADKLKEEKVEGVKDQVTMVYRFWRGKIIPMMSIESERAKYSAEFALDGTMTSFKKN